MSPLGYTVDGQMIVTFFPYLQHHISVHLVNSLFDALPQLMEGSRYQIDVKYN
jgi:hypothetical protein